MNKMDFDSALRRQVMSLPELMRQQYADLEPKTRTVLSTPEIFNIQRIVLTGCGDSYAALLAVKPAFEKYAKIRTEVVPTIDLARDYEKKNLVGVRAVHGLRGRAVPVPSGDGLHPREQDRLRSARSGQVV